MDGFFSSFSSYFLFLNPLPLCAFDEASGSIWTYTASVSRSFVTQRGTDSVITGDFLFFLQQMCESCKIRIALDGKIFFLN